MKRSELISVLTEAGCFFYKHGGRHDLWKNPDGKTFAVPRHAKEVPTGTAARIKKDAGINT